MIRQYGGRTTIAAAVLVFVALLVLLGAFRPLALSAPEAINARVEDAAQLEAETFTAEDPAEALIDSAKIALEQDAAKSSEEKQAEANAAADAEAEDGIKEGEPEGPGGEIAEAVPQEPSKVVIMGKMENENTEWVHDLDDWQHAVYCVDLNTTTPCPTGLKTRANKAKEAMPYLTYIIDHYAALPDIMAFVHAHRTTWHNDAPNKDAVRMLRALRLPTVLERGYVNLRCITELGCPDEVQPFRSPPADDKHAEHAFPYYYSHFFDATFEEMKANISVVATPCCAQFAVSRAQVLQREVGFYERVRDFLENTHYDDDTSGRVMEYMWHIIFGREAVHCEDLFQCWCKVYGRCKKGWAA